MNEDEISVSAHLKCDRCIQKAKTSIDGVYRIANEEEKNEPWRVKKLKHTERENGMIQVEQDLALRIITLKSFG